MAMRTGIAEMTRPFEGMAAFLHAGRIDDDLAFGAGTGIGALQRARMAAGQFLGAAAGLARWKNGAFFAGCAARDRDGMAAGKPSGHGLLAQGLCVVAVVAARQLARVAAVQLRSAFQSADDAANGEILRFLHLSPTRPSQLVFQQFF